LFWVQEVLGSNPGAPTSGKEELLSEKKKQKAFLANNEGDPNAGADIFAGEIGDAVRHGQNS
jgi:hypothetical protein